MKNPFFKRFDLFKGAHEQAEEAGVKLHFDKLVHTTRIVISTKMHQQLMTIQDPEIIKRLVSFIQTHHSGWVMPEEGVPVVPVRLNFFAGEKSLGSFGVGKRTFTAHHQDGFFTKCPAPEDRDKLVELIGLKEHFPA